MDALAPQSPFLPGTKIQYAWDATSLSALKTCPRKYELEVIEGWQPKASSIHLRFGIEYHAALQDYDLLRAQGIGFHDAVRQAVRALLVRIQDFNPDPTSKAGRYKNPASLVQLVVDYFDHFRDDPAETVILENGKPAVELSFRFELDWGPERAKDITKIPLVAPQLGAFGGNVELDSGKSLQPYILCGHLDRVVRYLDATMILDHKTTTTTPSSYYFDGFNPHNQMTLYTFAGRVVYNMPIKGILVEAAQIKLEEPNVFVRGITHRTDDQITEWLDDLYYWLNLAESYAKADHWPMNDTACGNYGGCPFRGVCSKSPAVRSQFLAADFIQLPLEERWNPLRSR